MFYCHYTSGSGRECHNVIKIKEAAASFSVENCFIKTIIFFFGSFFISSCSCVLIFAQIEAEFFLRHKIHSANIAFLGAFYLFFFSSPCSVLSFALFNAVQLTIFVIESELLLIWKVFFRKMFTFIIVNFINCCFMLVTFNCTGSFYSKDMEFTLN